MRLIKWEITGTVDDIYEYLSGVLFIYKISLVELKVDCCIASFILREMYTETKKWGLVHCMKGAVLDRGQGLRCLLSLAIEQLQLFFGSDIYYVNV